MENTPHLFHLGGEVIKKVTTLSVVALSALIGSSSGFANDHAEMEGPFETPMEVTAIGLECYEDAATEVMAKSILSQ